MYGLPDSWAGWAGKKLFKATAKRDNTRTHGGLFASRAPKLGVEYALKDVILYPDRMHQLLNAPAGTLGKVLGRRAKYMHRMAKSQVGVKTGALRASIYLRHLGNKTGQYITMGSDKPYAYLHHQGTRPHLIYSASGKVLTFSSKKGGAVAHATVVKHPGTRPNRFLYDPMKIAFQDLGRTYSSSRVPKNIKI